MSVIPQERQLVIVGAIKADVGKLSFDLEMQYRFLAESGYDVVLICERTAASALESYGANRFKYEVVPTSPPGAVGALLRNWKFFWRLLQLRRTKPDIFYISEAPMCIVGLVALAGVSRHRIIYHAQNFIDPLNHPWRSLVQGLFCRRSGRVVVNDPGRAWCLQAMSRLEQRPLVVRTAMPRFWGAGTVNRDEVRAAMNVSAQTRVILHQGPYRVGRMSPQVLAALALLPAEYVLMFTGASNDSADWRACVDHAIRLRLEKRIYNLGDLPFADLPRCASACDAGLLLYPDDSIGNYFKAPGRLTQYLACGLPIVAPDFPALENILLRHRAGETCDPESAPDIARAIRKVCETEEPLLERARRLRRVFEEHLAYEVQAERLRSMIMGFARKCCS